MANGGSLVLEMGDKPNKKWGSAPSEAPPSMSQTGSDLDVAVSGRR
jgi:putative alpha-1,2-mannosidase